MAGKKKIEEKVITPKSIEEAIKESNIYFFDYPGEVEVNFINHGKTDSTTFDVSSRKELKSLWRQFCKEEDINPNCVITLGLSFTDHMAEKIDIINNSVDTLVGTLIPEINGDHEKIVEACFYVDIFKSITEVAKKYNYEVKSPVICTANDYNGNHYVFIGEESKDIDCDWLTRIRETSDHLGIEIEDLLTISGVHGLKIVPIICKEA